jgi:hypothetical protein
LSLDVDLYSRLCAKAVRQRTSISRLAEEYIRAGLKGFIVIDRSGSVDTDNRQDGASVISGDDEKPKILASA